MSKRQRSRHRSSNSGAQVLVSHRDLSPYSFSEYPRRDAPAIASARPEFLPAALFSVSPRSSRYLAEIEDRRFFYPGVQPAAGLRNSRHRLRLALSRNAMGAKRPTYAAKRSAYVPDLRQPARAVRSLVGFRAPQSILICIRRRMRREALFGLGKVRGPASRKRPRRNWYSSVSCRR